ncbi:inorganic phosphate transporter [Halococcus saccharolyticus]|uniref:Phosphate transporter n=1 Tax=Halococcus saccharolyticus DSM 5350 TaxID=1227455 RepID=M0MM23_9EURY|nr:inorganic phosphate transporter [Halococcus saccharolyticus]EMA46742.1 sodium-dependent phosphate transporter [Halococcus saccharolyticus DSM 5350]
MVAAGTAAILVVATVASLFMAWTIGAGSSGSTPFAPAVGARAISVMRAGFLVGILGFLGAVLQGANVADAVGTGLVGGIALSPTASTVLLLLAAGLVAIGIFTGYPIATAFTVTGAVVGVGLGLGGSPVWPKYAEIGALWILTPFVGGGIAYITARTLRHEAIPERYTVPILGGIVGLIVANVPFTLLGSGSGGGSIAATVATELPVSTAVGTGLVSVIVAGLVAGALVWDLGSGVDSAERHFLLALGGLVAFSAGGSQVGLAVGPLLAAFQGTTLPFSVSLLALLVFGGIGLLAGSWMGAPRMIKAIAQDYSSLGPRRSIAALIPSFAIAQTAVVFGIPVSFNEIIVSAVIGSGFAAGGGGVSAQKMGYTVLAWIGSLALALGAGYAVITAIELL